MLLEHKQSEGRNGHHLLQPVGESQPVTGRLSPTAVPVPPVMTSSAQLKLGNVSGDEEKDGSRDAPWLAECFSRMRGSLGLSSIWGGGGRRVSSKSASVTASLKSTV